MLIHHTVIYHLYVCGEETRGSSRVGHTICAGEGKPKEGEAKGAVTDQGGGPEEGPDRKAQQMPPSLVSGVARVAKMGQFFLKRASIFSLTLKGHPRAS